MNLNVFSRLWGADGLLLSAVAEISGDMPTVDVISAEGAFFPVLYSFLPLLIFLGMAMMAVGAARAKNAASTALNQWVILAVSLIVFSCFGVLIFEGRLPASDWKVKLVSGVGSGNNSSGSLLVFQLGLVAVALSVACRSMIDRVRLRGLIVFSILFSGIVFPVLAQWAWGRHFSGADVPAGWLELFGVGFYDFAGAGVIHIVGGVFALAGAMVVGIRRGRLFGNGRLRDRPGHQPILFSLGVSVALIAWCGFHLGFASFLNQASGEGVILVTLIAASSAGLSAMALYRLLNGAVNFQCTLCSVIGGLVASSSCSASLNLSGALIVGAVAGLLVVLGTAVIAKLGIDDAGGVIPAHLICGFWGVAAVALFGPEEMRGTEGLKTQLVGGAVLALSGFLIALVLFKLIDNLFGLRVSEEEQLLGSDFNELSLNAYPEFERSEDSA